MCFIKMNPCVSNYKSVFEEEISLWAIFFGILKPGKHSAVNDSTQVQLSDTPLKTYLIRNQPRHDAINLKGVRRTRPFSFSPFILSRSGRRFISPLFNPGGWCQLWFQDTLLTARVRQRSQNNLECKFSIQPVNYKASSVKTTPETLLSSHPGLLLHSAPSAWLTW